MKNSILYHLQTITLLSNIILKLMIAFMGCVQLCGSLGAFFQNCVSGGRVVTRNNVKQYVEKCVQDFDAVSLYPSAMHLFEGFLKGMPKRITTTNYDELKRYDGLFLKVRVTKVGKPRPFPVLSHLDKAKGTKNWTNDLVDKICFLDKTGLEDAVAFQDVRFEVFDGYYGDNKKNFSQRVHERRALSAIIYRHKERTGQAGPQASFMAEGRDTLNTYTEEELRERAATDTEAAERIAQIDRERELFDLEPTEGTISGTADPLQTDRGQGSLFQESRTARMAAIRRRMDAAMERSGDRLQPRSRRSIERMRARRPREDAVERSRQETTRRFEQNERELAEAFDLPFPVREFINNNRLQEVIEGVVGDNQAARNNIIVVDRFSELPQAVQQDAQAQGLESVTAATQGGKVYLVRQNIVDQTHAERAILHESTHVGIEKMYADEGVERALNRMYVAMGGKSGFNRLVTKLGLDDRIEPYRAGLEKSNYSGAARNRILVDELLANVGEQGSKTFKLRVQEAIGAIRAWLRKNGFAKLSELGVTDIAFASRQARERFATDQSGTVASRDASAARFTGEGRTRAPRDDLGSRRETGRGAWGRPKTARDGQTRSRRPPRRSQDAPRRPEMPRDAPETRPRPSNSDV